MAHKLFPDFERVTINRGARISAISRALSALIRTGQVSQGAFCANGRYATYFLNTKKK
jgi:hypothetical protein